MFPVCVHVTFFRLIVRLGSASKLCTKVILTRKQDDTVMSHRNRNRKVFNVSSFEHVHILYVCCVCLTFSLRVPPISSPVPVGCPDCLTEDLALGSLKQETQRARVSWTCFVKQAPGVLESYCLIHDTRPCVCAAKKHILFLHRLYTTEHWKSCWLLSCPLPVHGIINQGRWGCAGLTGITLRFSFISSPGRLLFTSQLVTWSAERWNTFIVSLISAVHSLC